MSTRPQSKSASNLSINLQPDPRILVAITHNPMRPMDALCELVDNALDSFAAGAYSGTVDVPTVQIALPRSTDVDRGQGTLTVLDNGPGLSLEDAQNALRAGFTSHNQFDRLGLFGMGFNISTGKLGRKTVFTTARTEATNMISVIVDLENMVRGGSYEVPVHELAKKPKNFRGTIVQVSDWWPRGHQNHGFAGKLVRLGATAIREELGRRYSTILREKSIRIFVNDELVEPVEHCVWSEQRSVNHRQFGRISALVRFETVLQSQVRCMACSSIADDGKCPRCGNRERLRTIEERVRGWVGVQRFDDANDYGIDLIRNGRAIRKSEKEAFFTWTDSRGRQIKDYPVDGTFGRIVGEVHLDHVPTDFLKQDFQRSSPEWMRAMSFLRGDSSLQPRIAAEAEEPENNSPVFELFQGYRRVRDLGTRDMYMGYWEPGADKPSRISRDKEREYYRRFRAKEPGFYDDTEWWKLVEQADAKPIEHLKECPECAFQTLDTAETCSGCGYIFVAKTCIVDDCGTKMPFSSIQCPQCGASQNPRPQERWRCAFCARWNPPTAEICAGCGHPAGEVNPLSLEFLSEHSNKNDELSLDSFALPLPDGALCAPFNVSVHILEAGITLERQGISVPAVNFKTDGVIIFVDLAHPFFSEYQQKPEAIVAVEVAKYVQDSNARLMTGDRAHLLSLSGLAWQIYRHYWQDRLSVDPQRTRKRAEQLFDSLREALPNLLSEKSEEIYRAMPPDQQGQLLQTIVQNGHDARELVNFVQGGTYLSFLDNRNVAMLIERYPSCFFDGRFWSDAFEQLPTVDSASAVQVRTLILSRYRNFLEDILGFLEFRHKDAGYTVRADQTLHLLTRRMVL